MRSLGGDGERGRFIWIGWDNFRTLKSMHITEQSTTAQVQEWIRKTFACEDFVDELSVWVKDERVNGEVLLKLSEKHLKDELPLLRFGDRLRLYSRIQELSLRQKTPTRKTPIFTLDPALLSDDDSDDQSTAVPFKFKIEDQGSFSASNPVQYIIKFI